MKHIGLYIHVPFCASKCPYCDFYAERTEESVRSAFVSAVKRDIAAYGAKGDYCLDSIYFGGGTPSVLQGQWVAELLTCIRQHFEVSEDAEITVECNPSSDLQHFLPAAIGAGVNRVSLGLQSAVDAERRKLGRLATKEQVTTAIKLIRDLGVTNISLDIMLGVPEQTEESLMETLQYCVDTGVPHLSTYLLKLEEGTVFYKRQDTLNLPDEDTTVDFYEKTVAFLTDHGYEHYEISNFAKPGYEGQHNLKYWHCEEYLGLGPAAHSFLDRNRFFYDRNLTDYLNGTEPIADGTGGDLEERLMLALRLKEGFSGPLPTTVMEKAKQPYLAPYLTVGENHIALTEKGFLVSNSVIAELLSAFEA